MAVDEPGAIAMFVDESRTFIDNNNHTFLVIHKTASPGTAQDIAHFFATDPAEASTHYIVGQDGTIVQCVQEKDGAGGNCCEKGNFASFLPVGQNLNNWSVSIEHCDPDDLNRTPLTEAQKAASFRLVQHICQRHNIPMRRATNDGQGGIIGHNDIDPVDRANCPGNYPWDELWTFLQPSGGNWMDTSQGQQAQNCWHATTAGSIPLGGNAPVAAGIFPAGHAPDYSTGIAQAWQSEYQNGRSWGPPLTYEFPDVDWGGNHIVTQHFAGGRCEWNGGPNWFAWGK